MFSKLTFGQKLGVWLGCAIFIVIGGITAICFQLSKSPPKDMDKLIPSWAHPKFSSEDAWKASEKLFTAQIKKYPHRANLYRERGLIRWWLDRKDEAMSDFNKAIELDPKDYLCLSYRGQLHTHKNEYDDAIRDLDKAIELEKNDGSLYYQRGIAYHWKDKLSEAQKDYEKSLTFDYDKRRVHNALGRVLKKRKELDKAIFEFQESTKYPEESSSFSSNANDSAEESPFSDLIDLLIAKGRIREANDAANAWLNDTSKEESAYDYSASTARALGDSAGLADAQKKHIAYLDELIAQEPEEEDWRLSRARIYLDLNDRVKAMNDFEFVIEKLKKRKSAWINNWLASVYEEAGQAAKAKDIYAQEIAAVEQKLKKKPGDMTLQKERAYSYLGMKDYASAIRCFTAIKNKENKSSVTNGLIDASLAVGDFQTALNECKTIPDKNTFYYSRLAEIYERLGRHADAVEAARKSIALEETTGSAYYWLGKALGALGQTEESKLRLQQSIAYDYNPSK
jgi:tetratricopeptide (TPR) repeat protein